MRGKTLLEITSHTWACLGREVMPPSFLPKFPMNATIRNLNQPSLGLVVRASREDRPGSKALSVRQESFLSDKDPQKVQELA